jgi:hypothetical protein
LLGPAIFWQGGVLEREATTFITQYTADRPLLNKIFDPRANDLGTYQARELSYFVDYVDAQVYRLVLQQTGALLFVPVSALATSLALVLVFMRGVRHTARNVGVLNAALLLGCFLTSFMFVSTMGIFYRSSKALVAAALLALVFHVRRLWRQPAVPPLRRSQMWAAGVTFLLALVIGLSDREGVFYVLVFCGMLAIRYWWTGEVGSTLVVLVAAAVTLQIYNFLLAPAAIRMVSGYWPDFSYQMLPGEQSMRVPIYGLLAVVMMVQNAVFLVGGLPGLALIAFASAGVMLSRATKYEAGNSLLRLASLVRYEPDRQTVLYVVFACASQVLMFALMIARHPYVYFWLDHRYWYYAMPFVVMVLFGLLIVLDAAIPRIPPQRQWVVPFVLCGVILSNLASLNGHRRVMQQWPWFNAVYEQSEAFKSSMRVGAAEPVLDSWYRPFFEYQRRMLTVAGE